MVQINFALKEVNCKIVYYGPGMSGKTTNLEVVHQKAPESNKGELTSIATEGDRTLFFDFMPLDLGNIAGMRTKFQLYTVPGQVYYNSTRKLVLQGVDGIIFVADSQGRKMDENLESLENLRNNLAEYGKKLEEIPLVIQYNKRDLPEVEDVETLNKILNPRGCPWFEGVATTGEGVFPTLKALSAMVLESLARDRGAPAAASQPKPAPAPAVAEAPVASAPIASPAGSPGMKSISDESFGAVAPAARQSAEAPAARPARPEPVRPKIQHSSPPPGIGSGSATAQPTGPTVGNEAPVYPTQTPSVERTPAQREGPPAQPPQGGRADRGGQLDGRSWGGPGSGNQGMRQGGGQNARLPRFVIEDERGSPVIFVLLVVITLVALGVILYSFKVI